MFMAEASPHVLRVLHEFVFVFWKYATKGFKQKKIVKVLQLKWET